jgi:hypothetical protein
MISPDLLSRLGEMPATQLREVIAHASGLAAHKDGDGGMLLAKALDNISSRLRGQPRRAA